MDYSTRRHINATVKGRLSISALTGNEDLMSRRAVNLNQRAAGFFNNLFAMDCFFLLVYEAVKLHLELRGSLRCFRSDGYSACIHEEGLRALFSVMYPWKKDEPALYQPFQLRQAGTSMPLGLGKQDRTYKWSGDNVSLLNIGIVGCEGNRILLVSGSLRSGPSFGGKEFSDKRLKVYLSSGGKAIVLPLNRGGKAFRGNVDLTREPNNGTHLAPRVTAVP
ncbi:hypothetical protein J6590_056930 [Homalodisca vitripennis]|nr:hypothetical protein J6590_056930 [Homalodisca vitripennis]